MGAAARAAPIFQGGADFAQVNVVYHRLWRGLRFLFLLLCELDALGFSRLPVALYRDGGSGEIR